MAPFVHFGIDLDKLFPVLTRWDDRERSARIELKPEPVGIERPFDKLRTGLSASSASKVIPSMSGLTPMMSLR